MDNLEGTEGQDKPQTGRRFSFAKDIVITYNDGEASIHLRRPSVKELNDFDKQSTPVGRKGIKADKIDHVGARVALFDALFIKAVNFEDENGPIPEDALDRIPADEKNYVILNHVQVKDEIDVKN
jgi:hypothetical protein